MAAPESHDIKLAASDEAHVGQTRSLSLTIVARSGHTISRYGPLYIDLSIPQTDGGDAPVVELSRSRYQRRDAADVHADAPRFDLRYRARTEGQATVRAHVFFWICGPRLCWPVRDTRDVRIDVYPPPHGR